MRIYKIRERIQEINQKVAVQRTNYITQIPDEKIQNSRYNILEKIREGLFGASLIAAIIIFLMALGWNDQYLGDPLGGIAGNTIADLGNYRHWGVIFPRLFLAIVYPIIALFQLDFQPFLVVYLCGIGGAIFFLLLANFLANK